MVAVANGALLSLFALVQLFNAPPQRIYWTLPTPGLVFGPFICRTHFAFYLNLCFGLGLGLLLSRDAECRAALSEKSRTWALMLHDPQTLWLSGALALMLSGVVLSLSRGGVLSLLAGCLVCLLVGARSWRLSLQQGAILLMLGLALGIGSFGMGRIEARIAALGQDDPALPGRMSVWQRVLPVVSEFPWLGTGLGTFGVVEPLSRPPGEDASVVWDHAHNDYLEALVEGGLARLLLSLLAVGLVLRLGIRSYRHNQGRPQAGLVLGALLGFTAVATHSVVDFGLHVPAVALLSVTVAAFLCMPCPAPAGDALASSAGDWRTLRASAGSFQLGWGASPIAAALLVLLGALLVHEARREEVAERLRRTAVAADQDQRIESLCAAVALTPENAALRVELAEAYLAKNTATRRAGEAAQLLINLAPDAAGAAGAMSADIRARTVVRLALADAARETRSTLVPAVQHYLQARAVCPLLPLPHLRLAALRDELLRAEPCRSYLARAKRLRPADTDVWYIAGLEELQQGDQQEAWRSWRQALRCSKRYLPDIVARSMARLSPAELVAQVLPANAEQLAAAAVQVFPDPADASKRRVFLEPALALLATPRDAATWHLKGRLHDLLGQPEDALAAYRAALSRAPRQTDWRYEYAQLLYEHGRLQPAREELIILLDQDPNHARAGLLLPVVNRKLRSLP
jgi:tetratricopeptide (TPR) repeat protein